MSETGAQITPIASLDPEARSSLAWLLAAERKRRGEGEREALLWAIRNGARIPDDLETRGWIVDVLEGKLAPDRGRGRPRKKQSWDLVRAVIEDGIWKAYCDWFTAFQSDRELAWLRSEAQRLAQKQPDAAAWRNMYDLGTEEGRQSFKTALADLGARACPPAARGAESARELALAATVEQCSRAWKSVEDKRLTSATVARIVTRAKKSARAKKSK
jgi:hypothetical protein